MMKNRRRFVAGAALAAATLATAISPAAGDDPPVDNSVVEWNAIAVDTVLADSATRTPSASSLYVAIAQAAVYNATMAIERSAEA